MIESFVVPSILGDLTSTFSPLGNHLPQILDTGGVCGSPEAHTDDGNWHRLVLLEKFRSILSLDIVRVGKFSDTISVEVGSHVESAPGAWLPRILGTACILTTDLVTTDLDAETAVSQTNMVQKHMGVGIS